MAFAVSEFFLLSTFEISNGNQMFGYVDDEKDGKKWERERERVEGKTKVRPKKGRNK